MLHFIYMADAPSGGGGWSALEIILVIVLAIGFMTQLQNGFTSTPDTAQPVSKDTSTQVEGDTCGLVLSRPHSLEKVTSFVSLTGRIEGCAWVPTETVAMYAQVIDSRGKTLSPYVTVPPINKQYESAYVDATIPLTTQPATSKGFLILVPAQTQGQTNTLRIPITFVRS
jgi:hypothetical protein